MTPQLIKACTGADLTLATKYAPFLTEAMTQYGVDTAVRQTAFLAQLGHESGGLQWFHELWGPTSSQMRYERSMVEPWPTSPTEANDPKFDRNRLAYTLGNDHPGDGRHFAGRGPIQITGRTNYRLIGSVMGLSLEENPALLDDSRNACLSAGAFWKLKGCNTFADAGDFIGLTKRINGGSNGLADRQLRWARAKLALNIAT